MKIYTEVEAKQLRPFNQRNTVQYVVKGKDYRLLIDNKQGKNSNQTTQQPFFKGFLCLVSAKAILKIGNHVQDRKAVIAEIEENPGLAFANPIIYLNVDGFVKETKAPAQIVDLDHFGLAELMAVQTDAVPMQFVLVGVSAKAVTHSQAFHDYVNAGMKYKHHVLSRLCPTIIRG